MRRYGTLSTLLVGRHCKLLCKVDHACMRTPMRMDREPGLLCLVKLVILFLKRKNATPCCCQGPDK